MPNDTYSTYGQDTKELFWDPFATQWELLGFTDAQDVFDKYGKLFPGYDDKAEKYLYEQTDASIASERAAYDMMLANETERLQTNRDNRQFNSELQLSSLERKGQAGEELGELKKEAVTRQAIESMDKAKKNIARSGISSGSIQSKLNMNTDTVKSKINSANASQAFARRRNKQSIENLKSNLGYMDANNNWVQGSQGQLEQIKVETSTGLAETKLENRSEIQRYEADLQAANMYEAWQQDIYASVGKLFREDPTGSRYSACEEVDGEWDFQTGACSEDIDHLVSETGDDGGDTTVYDEDVDIVYDHDDDYEGEGGGDGDEYDNEYDEYDDIDYEEWEPGGYGDGYS